MKRSIKLLSFAVAIFGMFTCFVSAAQWMPEKKTIIPDKVTEKITIDGKLTEKAWSEQSISLDFKTFTPVYGDPLNKKTLFWLAYDAKSLYFAFYCYEEPGKIKSSISQRDSIFNDDYVAVLLDAMGTKQSSYEFYVNPNGIQADSLNSAVSGSDPSPDFVWESAGTMTDDGYTVEIRVPLKSIRFKSGKNVTMGLLLLRNASHSGTGATWPETQPGDSDFSFMVNLEYKNLHYGGKLEVLPSFTYGRDQVRETPDDWGEADNSTDFGVSLKYGLTSSITAEATINPDFSQVESDAFQMDVNNRYPTFYSEKRPFFMEGMDILDFGTVNRGMLLTSVHTRLIVDPNWATKLSGSAGKLNFAVLAADDNLPDIDNNIYWGIVRGKYNLGKDNAVGLIYSSRYFDEDYNHVVGLDVQYRPFKNARFNAAYLYSQTGASGASGVESYKDSALSSMFQYSVPSLNTWATYEYFGEKFAMESAFINRGSISRAQFYAGPDFYLKIKGAEWLRRIQPYVYFSPLHDYEYGMNESYWNFGTDFYFAKQGFFKAEFRKEKEVWLSKHYNMDYAIFYATVRPSKWLVLAASLRTGERLYYHYTSPFLGKGRQSSFSLVIQPNLNLSLSGEWIHSTLDRKDTNENFYKIDIFNTSVTYNFSKHFFIRGAVRYDSFRKRILTDFLASFTLIPGTVMHLGYGSLYERRDWIDNAWVPRQGKFVNMRNGLFFKISYLWRIK